MRGLKDERGIRREHMDHLRGTRPFYKYLSLPSSMSDDIFNIIKLTAPASTSAFIEHLSGNQ